MSFGTSSNTYPIPTDARPGVIALATISTISTTCVSLLLLSLFIITVGRRREGSHDERTFLRTHIGALVVCLFISDLIQGISGMITLAWVKSGQVSTGSLCLTQAIMLHIGDVGTAYWNAVIAIHTFWTVVLGRRTTTAGIASLIAGGWSLCFFVTMLGPFALQTERDGPFYAIAGAWCFITTNYKIARIMLHYFPMLLSAAIITVLYIQVALVLFGILAVDGGVWRLQAPTRKGSSGVRSFFRRFSWSRLRGSSAPASGQVIDIQSHVDTTSTGVSEGSLERGGKSKSNPAENQSAPGISVFDNGPSSRPARLKKLAVKMLWYPTAYMFSILPMAITRISPSLNVSLDVVLGFTCMLLFMGTANTLIYLFTRRIGPTPWSRRYHTMSISTFRPWRSKSERLQTGTMSLGDMSLQIQTEHYGQPPIDDPSTDLALQKTMGSGITDASSIVGVDHSDDLTRGYKDNKIRFDLTKGKPTRHDLRSTLPPGPDAAAAARESFVPHLEYQEPSSPPPALSLPNPRARPQEREQPGEDQLGHHPYSHA